MLVLWGHALGFNFGHASDPTTALELNQVLKKFSALRGRPLDILGCDTCRMSKIELAALLQGSVDLIVASETGTPLTSWPYEPILNAVSSKPDLSPKEFGRAIIDNYCARYRPVGVSLTMLDLKHGLPVFDAVEELGMALLKAIADRKTGKEGSGREPLSRRGHIRTASTLRSRLPKQAGEEVLQIETRDSPLRNDSMD